MAALLSDPHLPMQDFLSGSSPRGNFWHGFGRPVSSQLSGVEEEGGGAVHVAVGKSVEKAIALLQWSFRMFQGQEICLLHVHRPSPLIPTLLGKLPASQANSEVVAAFRNEEREETMKLLSNYLMTCSRSRVKASIITTEADEVQKGIVYLVNLHTIKKLVIGAIPDCMKGKKRSRKASHAAKHAPPYCEMWFVNKGKLIWTRQASESSSSVLPICQVATADTHNLRSRSLYSDRNELEESWTDMTALRSSIFLKNSHDPLYCENVSSSTNSSSFTGYTISDEPETSVSSARSVEECLCIQLAELKVEADESKNKVNLELLQNKKLGPEVMGAISKVKALDVAHFREVKLRTDSEDALRITIEEQEKLLEERDEIIHQLQKTMRNIALLDSRAQEANRRCEEVAGELKLIQASIATLRKEKQKLQWQKIEGMRCLDRWRSDEQYDDAIERKLIRDTGDTSEIPEFSLSDLETATCNFSESFRIGQGGYGTVYKGEMLDKSVAIKKLHSYNIQRQMEFHKAGQVLGKLHNPHLMDLIGVCSESLLLVYEYLPGGSLQNHFFNSNNIYPLNWKIRARIVADIATGLLFLHSFKPEKIVHGNLKPENVLLDSEYRCKISDYGDHMLIASLTLRCPSFRHCTGSSCALSYTDPESRRTGTLTHKSDIYSFGLIILQLVTGKTLEGLVAQVRRAVSNGKLASILDLSASDWSTYVARRLVELGLQCCESNSRDRPELTPFLVEELERLHLVEEQTVPSFFLCPILQEIMHDPQVAADGFTYEGEALRGWLGNGHETSPMTNLRLSHLNLIPNHTLRIAIQDWLRKS